MTSTEDVFAASEAAARAELAEAEAALLDAEAAVRVARAELDAHLIERVALTEALAQVGKNSPAAPRLVVRIHSLRHAEGPHILATGVLKEAQLRVERLKAEIAEMERLAAPPEPAAAEDMERDTVLN